MLAALGGGQNRRPPSRWQSPDSQQTSVPPAQPSVSLHMFGETGGQRARPPCPLQQLLPSHTVPSKHSYEFSRCDVSYSHGQRLEREMC